MIKNLTEMKIGDSGIVKELQGGMGFTERIRGMGIYPGKKIKKTGAHFWRGPVTVVVDSFQVAIGYGMASRVIVELEG